MYYSVSVDAINQKQQPCTKDDAPLLHGIEQTFRAQDKTYKAVQTESKDKKTFRMYTYNTNEKDLHRAGVSSVWDLGNDSRASD